MFDSFFKSLREYNNMDAFNDESKDFSQNTAIYRTNSAGLFSKANDKYSDADSSVALFSYDDANRDRRYGFLIIPKKSLYERDKNPNTPLQIIGAELDDGTTLGFDDTIKFLRKIDTNIFNGGADTSREQFSINIPSGENIEGTEKTYFGVDSLRDAFDYSKRAKKDYEELLRSGQFKKPIEHVRPNIKNINIPKLGV